MDIEEESFGGCLSLLALIFSIVMLIGVLVIL